MSFVFENGYRLEITRNDMIPFKKIMRSHWIIILVAVDDERVNMTTRYSKNIMISIVMFK